MPSASFVRRHRFFTVGLLLMSAAWSAGLVLRRPQSTFTPYVAAALPQRATADFDGDGRSDVAHVEQRADGPSISLALSGSGTAELRVRAAALVEADVDHDGDVDLIAVTSTGELLILINDGHGRFTPQEAFHTSRLSPALTLRDAHGASLIAVMSAAVSLPSDLRRGALIAAARVRPLAAALFRKPGFLLIRSLRAPPAILA
jgi:hypothetical protein